MKKLSKVYFIVPIIFLSACSDEHNANEHQSSEGHMNQNTPILKSQMQAIEKAKGVEQLMNNRVQTQLQEIDQVSQ
jgi:hypothetical protein